MLNQCPQCRTMMNAEAPYCDACGCTLPPMKPGYDFKPLIGAASMFATVIVTIALLHSFVG
jgi:hypothetical protein